MSLSAVIIVPALVARYKLADSPLFEQLKRCDQVARAPSLTVLREHTRSIMLVALVLAFMLMDAYVADTYMISFMHFAGIPLATIATILLLSKILDVLGIVLSGPLADLLKRKTVAYVGIAVATVLSYPLVLAVVSRRVMLVMVLQFTVIFFGVGLLHGLAPIVASENFPTKFRYSGAGISYSLAAVLGAMIAPPVLAGLVGSDVLHKGFYLPVVYAIYCAAAMLSLLFMRETRNLSIDDFDRMVVPVGIELGAEAATS